MLPVFVHSGSNPATVLPLPAGLFVVPPHEPPGGLVRTEIMAVLPPVPAVACLLLSILACAPALLRAWKNPSPLVFAWGVVSAREAFDVVRRAPLGSLLRGKKVQEGVSLLRSCTEGGLRAFPRSPASFRGKRNPLRCSFVFDPPCCLLFPAWCRPQVHCSLSAFLVGFHVHEKALLVPAVASALLAIESPAGARMYLRLSFLAAFAAFPLLPGPDLRVLKVQHKVLHWRGGGGRGGGTRQEMMVPKTVPIAEGPIGMLCTQRRHMFNIFPSRSSCRRMAHWHFVRSKFRQEQMITPPALTEPPPVHKSKLVSCRRYICSANFLAHARPPPDWTWKTCTVLHCVGKEREEPKVQHPPP